MNISNYAFYAAYSHLNDFFDVHFNEEDFETIGLHAWYWIGNRRSRLYQFTDKTINLRLDLPCNVDLIESVHGSYEDYQKTDNVLRENHTKLTTESYIESRNTISHPLYRKGKLLDFYQEENTLVFSKDYPSVTVVYRGIIADEQGLPYINQKEVDAIATYCAYTFWQKKAWSTRDQFAMQNAQMLKRDWERAVLKARTPEIMTQNEMDEILDVSTRWDRKRYGMSYKPVLK